MKRLGSWIKRFRCVLSVVALLITAPWAQAQSTAPEPSPVLRDPTVAPNQPAQAGPGTPDTANPVNAGLSVIVVNGVSHVIIGTRLYAKGEMWGRTRIERITETEIWFREAGKLRKQPIFSGIERHSVSSVQVAPACVSDVRQVFNLSGSSLKTDRCPAGQPKSVPF